MYLQIETGKKRWRSKEVENIINILLNEKLEKSKHGLKKYCGSYRGSIVQVESRRKKLYCRGVQKCTLHPENGEEKEECRVW